jgi:putative tricarboxylic transport membrane protein
VTTVDPRADDGDPVPARLVASGGDASVFVDRPLTVGLLSAALFALVLPYLPSIVGKLRGRTRPAARLAFGEGD